MDPIKPIHSDEEHAEAVAEVERLWNARPGTPEHDHLEVLGMLVDAYETGRWPIEAPDPVEAIKFRMEQNGWSQSDLWRLLGSQRVDAAPLVMEQGSGGRTRGLASSGLARGRESS